MAGQLRLVQVDLRRRRMCVVVAEEPKEGRGKVGGVVNRCDRTGLRLRHAEPASDARRWNIVTVTGFDPLCFCRRITCR